MNDEGRLTAEDLADLRLAWCSGSGTVIATVERILAARASDGLADKVRALADEWTHATCQTDGAPCSWHRVSAECADELLALLPADTQDTDQ